MLNTTQGSLRQIAGLGIALAVTVSGMALASPAPGEEKTVTEKRVIITEGKGERAGHVRDGERMKCPGQMTVVESTSGTEQKKEQHKIAICSRTGNKAEIAEGLNKALTRLEGDNEMDASVRADLSAKLRAKIAEVQGR